jgi:hypothetical protein
VLIIVAAGAGLTVDVAVDIDVSDCHKIIFGLSRTRSP